MSHKQVLNSARRRVRKEQLARRHGRRCTYCRRPFADLREATLDHIVPHSLWRTWTVTALALACLDCNNAKADRFPLALALVLLWSADPSRPTIGRPLAGARPTRPRQPVGFHRRVVGRRVGRPDRRRVDP